ncbi:MAG: MiaB/RimO family radical SAM methylthiotransferase, partial [Desulfovibrio sp.]|nr:MiaB/RimO family radical SAM methylthiotransferase [Desulfovibrio sp.]
LPEVDLWLATTDLQEARKQLVARVLGGESPHISRLLSTPPSYAWLKIGDGCRHHCAFCTIPSIRGPLRSVPCQTLLEEAKALLLQGVRELDLVAQDVTSYGYDSPMDSLPNLLGALCELDKLHWLRLLYLYPKGLTAELLSFLSKLGKPFLPYFDLPLQHVSLSLLKRMGRPWEEDPRQVLERVRHYFPDAVLRSTFIVGFPGETEADFQELCQLVEEGFIQNLGVFAYSPEEGTKAFDYPNQLAKEVAEERKNILLELQAEVSRKFLSRFLGQRMEVLVDKIEPDWPGLYKGRVWFQAPEVDGVTYVSGEGVAEAKLVEAEIVEQTNYDLTALV